MVKLKELEAFFKKRKFKGSFVLSECETIIDQEKFIKSHLKALKSNPGNKLYLPYYDRLLNFYEKNN